VAGSTSGFAARGSGTYYHSNSAIAAQGAYARGAYGYGGAVYPAAWGAAAAAPWAGAAAWGAVAANTGYPQQPSYYDYGGNVVAQDNTMYVNGDPVGTTQEYAAQAGDLAQAGANAPPADATSQSLGVFGIVGGDETAPNEFFQIAISPKGILSGNYHNSQTNETLPISGSVDPKTLRAAWTINKSATPVFEAGIANLSKEQTTMLVHGDDGQSQQTTLARMPAPDITQK